MPTDPAPLTEDQARGLLARAARTIDADPVPPVPYDAPRRRWPVLVAAAAVLVVVLGTALLGLGGDGTDRGPRPLDGTGPTSAGPAGDDLVPPVIGLSTADATRRLEDRGWSVSTRTRSACVPNGTVLASDPPAGTRVAPGRPVVLEAAPATGDTAPTASCARYGARAYLLVGALNGGAPPPVAGRVLVSVDGSATYLRGSDLGDLDAWGLSAGRLAAVRAALATGTELEPVRERAPCGEVAADLGRGRRTAESTVLRVPGGVAPTSCGGLRIDAFYSGEELDTLVLSTSDGTAGALGLTGVRAPDVRGLTAAGARARLSEVAPGTPTSTTYREVGCGQGADEVTDQEPAAGVPLRRSGLTVVVAIGPPGCGAPVRPTAAQRAVADAVVAFAVDDGPAPPLAERVELFVGNAAVAVATRAELADPGVWRGCPEGVDLYAGGACPSDLLGGLASDRVNGSSTAVVTRPTLLPSCGVPLAAALPARLTTRASVFLEPEEGSCGYGYRLQLVLDAQDRIVAANLTGVEP